MEIEIADIPTFAVPVGNYRAQITEVVPVDTPKAKQEKGVRVKMDIQFPSKAGFLFVAGKNYGTGKRDKALIEDARAILGEDFNRAINENGKFDSDALIGREVDIVITHIHGEGYAKPYSHVDRIYPAGTLYPKP